MPLGCFKTIHHTEISDTIIILFTDHIFGSSQEERFGCKNVNRQGNHRTLKEIRRIKS